MFTTLFVQPIFNILVFIYAIIPYHNFGLALIIFTVLSRFALWPLLKKQLHQAKAMQKIQPELKKIKQATKGDKQKEQTMMMELYKERGINPFGQIGLLIVQLPLFFAIYGSVNKLVQHREELFSFSYSWVRDLPWMKELAADPSKFDNSLFGLMDLSRAAFGNGSIYFPAVLIVLASAILQYFVSKQLSPSAKDSKGLKAILKDASAGKMTDQSDVNAAVTRNMLLLTPLFIAVFTITIPAALALYLLAGSVVAYFQQKRVLESDEVEMEALADGEPVEATIVENPKKETPKKRKKPTKKKRR